MRRTLLSISSTFTLLGISTHSLAQTTSVTYNFSHAVPVLGTGMILLLGILLCTMGAVWLHRNPGSSLGKLALSAIGLGLLASTMSAGWLVGNAQAVVATTTYLMSDNPSPVVVTSYPAVLENDFDALIFVSDIEVTGCPLGSTTSGTCQVGSAIPGGESCTLDTVCDAPATGSFTSCVGNWCLQQGTLGQSTQCESASPDGLTCFNPEIQYGSVAGGIPADHTGNDYAQWCQQLGFTSDTGVTLGLRSTAAPNGRLFGCTSYDETNWHWCDWQDGDWLDESLDNHTSTGAEITSISCSSPD